MTSKEVYLDYLHYDTQTTTSQTKIITYYHLPEWVEVKVYKDSIRPLSTFGSCAGCGFYEDMKMGKPIVSDVCYYCNNSPIKKEWLAK